MLAVLTTMATAVHTVDFERCMISGHTSQHWTDCLPWDSAILLSEPTHCSLLFLPTAAYTGSVLKSLCTCWKCFCAFWESHIFVFSFLQQRKWRSVCLANSVSCFANDLSKHWKVQTHYTHVVHYSYLHIRSMCIAQCQHRMPTLYIEATMYKPHSDVMC